MLQTTAVVTMLLSYASVNPRTLPLDLRRRNATAAHLLSDLGHHLRRAGLA